MSSQFHLKPAYGFLLAALALAMAGAPASRAQIVSGSIVGVVSDSTGAVIPDASVTATNAATGLARNARTDVQGVYTLPQLPPGIYSVAVTAEGFKRAEVAGVTLLVGQTARVDTAPRGGRGY